MTPQLSFGTMRMLSICNIVSLFVPARFVYTRGRCVSPRINPSPTSGISSPRSSHHSSRRLWLRSTRTLWRIFKLWTLNVDLGSYYLFDSTICLLSTGQEFTPYWKIRDSGLSNAWFWKSGESMKELVNLFRIIIHRLRDCWFLDQSPHASYYDLNRVHVLYFRDWAAYAQSTPSFNCIGVDRNRRNRRFEYHIEIPTDILHSWVSTQHV